MQEPFISRVVINNYKSIAHCDVQLGALQFLVGRNGAGKSNFLDALAFVRDVLEFNNLEKAVSDRVGGIFHSRKEEMNEKMKLIVMQLNLDMKIKFNLSNGANGVFAFHIRKEESGHIVTEESCRIEQKDGQIEEYKTQNGKLLNDDPQRFPPVASDRFYLQNMSAYNAFRPLYDALRTMRIYNFVPQHIVFPDRTSSNSLLMSDGNNVAQVVSELTDGTKNRIQEYLQLVVPDIYDFCSRKGREGKYLEFQHKAGDFLHESMSDGTLRALCILTALLHERKDGENNHPVLIGIEEPETGLHASAAGVFLGAMMEAADMRQVIVATHSAEMLDDKEIEIEQILPVEMRDAKTIIAPLENVTKDMLREHLTTVGRLLRQDHLQPELSLSASDK